MYCYITVFTLTVDWRISFQEPNNECLNRAVCFLNETALPRYERLLADIMQVFPLRGVQDATWCTWGFVLRCCCCCQRLWGELNVRRTRSSSAVKHPPFIFPLVWRDSSSLWRCHLIETHSVVNNWNSSESSGIKTQDNQPWMTYDIWNMIYAVVVFKCKYTLQSQTHAVPPQKDHLDKTRQRLYINKIKM